MSRVIFLIVVLWLMLTGARGLTANAAGPGIVISGGDLPHAVRLNVADEDAFRRHLGPQPQFAEAQEPPGGFYTVDSSYWDAAVRRGDTEELPVAASAAYYQEGGYVRTRQGSEDVWLVLDLRQRAILDRYIRLSRAGLVSDRPGVLEVLAYAWRSERVSVHIGADRLSRQEENIFFTGVIIGERPQFREPEPPPSGPSSVWLVFNLEEGRSVQVLYDPDKQEFIDSFGSEVYKVARQSAFAIASASTGRSGLRIEQERGRGSLLWWPLLLGGGSFCLAAAVWLRRKSTAREAA